MAQPDLDPPLPVVYPASRWSPAWAIPEVPVSESDTHVAAIDWLWALLVAWVERTGRDVKVARNLGIRWVREERRLGFDPDLCLIEPAPDPSVPLGSLRLWRDGHVAPMLAIEVVSQGHPYKDYVDTPERCAACGVRELWVYDPMLVGPRARGGPYLLQVWRRRDDGGFERLFAGSGTAHSPILDAWLHPAASQLPAGAQLNLSDDEAGEERWLSSEQRLKISEQQARASEQRARASEQQALASEQQALASEQRARASEQGLLDQLERERRLRAELEEKLRQYEPSRRR